LLGEFAEAAAHLYEQGVRFVFGGTPPVAERATHLGFFERVFDGSQPDETVLTFLKGQAPDRSQETVFPDNLLDRIRWKSPFPLLRHHFGLPTLELTLAGVKEIAQSQSLDVVSLGIDQDAQENFFHPERQDARRKGAGGVPVRSVDDYRALYDASRCGNFPLMRTYSGTDDFIRLADLYLDTIHNAWCAIPLFWFNQMDGRGPWDLTGSIGEHQQVMRWYAEKKVPVELNEPHHWGMRDAPDVLFVVSAYLSAYNAKACGVQDYIAQMMFNSPPGTSDAMDLAKMLAQLDLIEPLSDDNFHIWKQTRTGLLSFPMDEVEARAHLAASVYLQMSLKPHIIHVVGYSEAHHAATAMEVIEACSLARRTIKNALAGQPDMSADPLVDERRQELKAEARITLHTIMDLAKPGVTDPLCDPTILASAVSSGILDAPQLKNNPFACGKIQTRIIHGKCLAVSTNGSPLTEQERLRGIQ